MLRLQLALLVEIVEGVADDLGKSDDGDEVRDDHDSVEEVRELPYEVELQRGTEDYEEHRYASEYRERLVAEEVLHVLLGEEVPADDRRVSKEEDADCDERRAEASKLPSLLYNVPGRTGVNMTAETTLRIARDFKNVIGVKEASGNITQMDDIIKNKPANFNVISGDDGITFPLITLGAIGVISVIGNAFPKEFSRMVRLALAGDYESARTIHHRFAELFKLLFVDGNPAGVKSMLNMMGLIENKLRLPLVPTRIVTYEKIRDVLQQLNIKC